MGVIDVCFSKGRGLAVAEYVGASVAAANLLTLARYRLAASG